MWFRVVIPKDDLGLLNLYPISSARSTSVCLDCVNLALAIRPWDWPFSNSPPLDFLTDGFFLSYSISSARPEARSSSTYHLLKWKGLSSSPTLPHSWHHYPKWFCFYSESLLVYLHPHTHYCHTYHKEKTGGWPSPLSFISASPGPQTYQADGENSVEWVHQVSPVLNSLPEASSHLLS